MNWKIFPNPAKDRVSILLNAEQSYHAVVEMTDHTGRGVYKQTMVVNSGFNLLHIKLPGLLPGVYYLRISDGKKTKVEPLVIH